MLEGVSPRLLELEVRNCLLEVYMPIPQSIEASVMQTNQHKEVQQ